MRPASSASHHPLIGQLPSGFQTAARAVNVSGVMIDIQAPAAYEHATFAYETKNTGKSRTHGIGHWLGLHGHVGILRRA